MAKFLEQMKQMWARWTPRQRLVVGGGTLATVLLVGALTRAFGSPEYKPLMVGLEPADAQAISAELAAKKISTQMTADGKGIDVAADQLDAARLAIASEGTPHSGRMGFELFDKVSWGQTEFDEKVNYQRALEGELERTIGTLRDVKSARVHLVLPRASVFLDRERDAKASVTLRLRHGAMPPEELDAIGRLVSGAVENLAPGDVAIIDADSNQSLGKKGGSAEGQELEEELSKRLVATLGPALGPENLRASVNVEYDLSSSEESQDKYDPAVSAVLTSQKSSEQTGAGAGASGVAGTSGNLPAGTGGTQASTQTATADDGTQISTSDNSTFGVNKIVRHTTSPAGRIRRISAALLINDAVDRAQVKGKWVETPRKRSTAQLKQIQELAQAVLGMDAQRGDVISVQNMTFDDGRVPDAPPTVLTKVREGLSEYATAVRYGAMLALFGLVYALMFRPVQKQMLASMRELGTGKPAAAEAALAAGEGAPELAAGEEAVFSDASGSALKKQLAELVQAEPVTMTRTVQAWLREDNA